MYFILLYFILEIFPPFTYKAEVLKDHMFSVWFPVCDSSTCVQLLVTSLMCLTCVLSPGAYGALLPCVFPARLSLLPQVLNFQRRASSVLPSRLIPPCRVCPIFATCVFTLDWITIKENTYRSKTPCLHSPLSARGSMLPVRYETHCPFCGKCIAYFSKRVSEPVARKKVPSIHSNHPIIFFTLE